MFMVTDVIACLMCSVAAWIGPCMCAYAKSKSAYLGLGAGADNSICGYYVKWERVILM